MNTLKKTLLAASIFAIAGVANAMPITGSIGFGGGYTHDGTNLSDATSITITDAIVQGAVTGSFAAEGIAAGDTAAYSNFVFNPISTPIASIWSVGSFSFDLTSMNVDFQSTTTLVLTGSGIINSTNPNLDTAYGDWSFTANQANQNFTWSSSSAPEPAVALLLGAGLIGFGFARKARKAA